jgi:methylated-DNA-[protein]-cysteine S-methyltransferase
MKKRKRFFSSDCYYDTLDTPIGTLFLVFHKNSLIKLAFVKPDMDIGKYKAPLSFIKELQEYFEKGRDEFTQKIEFVSGTEFDRMVWLALKDVPYGETRTYKWLAEKIGKPNASRAVGQSLSRNPLPIILPCHRIIESDGSIGGYSAGVNIKRRLLEMEYYIMLERQGKDE